MLDNNLTVDQASFAYPLSAQQKIVWDNPVAQPPAMCWELDGEFSASQLHDALLELLERHHTLTHQYPLQAGLKYPHQQVATDIALHWQSFVQQPDTEDQYQLLCDTTAKAPLGSHACYFAANPYLKARLWLSLPRLGCDTHSIGVLHHELGQLLRGQSLPALEIDFSQFVQWQDECLDPTDEDYQAAQKLIIKSTANEFAHPPSADAPVKQVTLRIDAPLRTQLNNMDIPLPALFVAASLLVNQTLSSDNLGSNKKPIQLFELNCRVFDELKGLVGNIGKTVPFCIEQYNNDTLLGYIQRVAQKLSQLNDVAEYLPPTFMPKQQMSLSYLPLTNQKPLKLVRLQAIHPTNSSLCIINHGDEINLQLTFNGTDEAASQYQLWLQRWILVLQQMTDQTEKPLNQLNILLADDQRLNHNSQGKKVVTSDVLISDKLTQQALKTPHKIALIVGQTQLSYQQLNVKVNQLSTYIFSHTQGRNLPVALCMPRSHLSIIAILACLKAGAAFVPLDIEDNPKHTAHLLSSINPALTLTDETFANLPASSVKHFTPSICPATLAYIIYTSGTTGAPKGVKISHGNLNNYTEAISHRLNFTKGLSYGCVSTLSADLGYSAVFSALFNGGTLHLLDHQTVTDDRLYRDYLARHAIDVIKMVPSHLQMLINNADMDGAAITELLPKQHLLLGGETLSLTLLDQLLSPQQAGLHQCQIHNHYGPSEATIGCFSVNLSRLPIAGRQIAASAPIGQALDNVAFAIVDEQNQPVPQLCAGQLIIGGAGISAGYCNASEQEQNRFLSFVFTPGQPPQPAYRSGDRARLLTNGCLEFLGRIDAQVKLRGYRVELPAIEQVIIQHPGVSAVSVGLHQPANAAPRLVAWWVASSLNLSPEENHLINHINSLLPEYMCPVQWLKLPRLPLTRNGKIDKKQLPNPDQALTAQQQYIAPQTQQEQTLAAVWGALLGIEKISQNDHFFELGGNSLTATQVVATLRQRTGKAFLVADLFDHPTLSGQAAFLDGLSEQSEPGQLTIKPVNHTGDHPLSYAQQRLWFLDQLNPGSAAYNVPAQIHFTQPVEFIRVSNAINQLWQCHDALRLRLSHHHQSSPCQYLDDEPLLIKQTRVNGLIDAHTIAQAEATKPFDLQHDALMRVHWVNIADEQSLLLVTLHHIISDAWSTDLLLADFGEAFNQQIIVSPQLNFIDHIHWQRQTLDQQKQSQLLGFWQKKLLAAPQYLTLPTDRPRPEYQTYAGAKHHATLSAQTVAALDKLALEQGASRFMVLSCVFNLLLSKVSDQQDLCVSIPVAGRTEPGLERCVGLFLNTLVLRTRLDQVVTPAQLLKQIKHSSINMLDHQQLSFDQLITQLPIERATSYTPFNQVCFNLLNTPLGKSLNTDVPAQLLTGDSCSAKYDFEWIVADSQPNDTQKSLAITVQYNVDLFDEQTIVNLVNQFIELANGLPQALHVPWQLWLTEPAK